MCEAITGLRLGRSRALPFARRSRMHGLSGRAKFHLSRKSSSGRAKFHLSRTFSSGGMRFRVRRKTGLRLVRIRAHTFARASRKHGPPACAAFLNARPFWEGEVPSEPDVFQRWDEVCCAPKHQVCGLAGAAPSRMCALPFARPPACAAFRFRGLRCVSRLT